MKLDPIDAIGWLPGLAYTALEGASQQAPAVVYLAAADGYAVAWHDDRDGGTNGHDIYLQQVEADSMLEGGNLALGTATRNEMAPRIAPDGNRTQMVDGAGTTTYIYDDFYRLITVTMVMIF